MHSQNVTGAMGSPDRKYKRLPRLQIKRLKHHIPTFHLCAQSSVGDGCRSVVSTMGRISMVQIGSGFSRLMDSGGEKLMKSVLAQERVEWRSVVMAIGMSSSEAAAEVGWTFIGLEMERREENGAYFVGCSGLKFNE
jgi:hypothetical protein